MAVFQISRIQIRRGQAATGTGLPQLASGEMAWAVDTQELYVGSGSVSEGAPAVGNVRILTLNDIAQSGNILSIGQYIYKLQDSTIFTGVSAGLPSVRTLQQKLDDTIVSGDFGMVGDGQTDNTALFQNAINQLFLNQSHPASLDNASGAVSRVKLLISPGIYNISSTVYIPSFSNIEGTGVDKVIFNYVPTSGDTSAAFKFINDTSAPGNYNTTANLQATNQPRYIQMSGFTIRTYNGTNTGMQLDSVRESNFENIKIKGSSLDTLSTYNATNIGIVLTALSSVVTCQNNRFKNINIQQTTIAVYAKQDILNNNFDNMHIWQTQQGFSFGVGSLGGSNLGQQYGPRECTISNSRFYQIRQQALLIERGEFNSITNCKMEYVGNDGANDLLPVYPQIFFKSLGNLATNIHSDRSDYLLNPSNTVSKYVPEVTGNVSYKSPVSYQVPVGQTTNGNLLFRLPASTDQYGAPTGAISYNIDYVYRDVSNTAGTSSTAIPFTRSGNFYITADVGRAAIQYADDYSFAGPDASNTVSQVLTFSAVFLDASGALYTGSNGQVATSLAVYYVNTLANDSGILNYSYSANSYYPF